VGDGAERAEVRVAAPHPVAGGQVAGAWRSCGGGSARPRSADHTLLHS
jgi:hypothetical protein